MTLASDILPRSKTTQGISRFAFTISIGMAVGPYVGIQVQNHMSSKASFFMIFGLTLVALICVSLCKINYPMVERKMFAIKDAIYRPALPFMYNMMFLMIPYGAVIAYSSMLAQEKHLMSFIPYFYICLVAGMLVSKLSTQRKVDEGKHKAFVYASLFVLIFTMASYVFLTTGMHLLIAGFLFGLGYGILQPLFQSFVTGTTPTKNRGVANATYLLSYDIGIGIGALLMGIVQETTGLSIGFALTGVGSNAIHNGYKEGVMAKVLCPLLVLIRKSFEPPITAIIMVFPVSVRSGIINPGGHNKVKTGCWICIFKQNEECSC